MSDGRHFDEQEVAEILAEATSTRAGSPLAVSDSGVTLAELREIGAEVGIDPQRIESAAHALMRRDVSLSPAATFLGAPRSLQRTARISRPPTDEEWRRVVTELRATFGARGTEEVMGSLHSWRHGDFQLTVEPDLDGAEIVMGASKTNVSRLSVLSVTSVTMAVLLIVLMTVGQFEAEAMRVLALLVTLAGVGGVGATAVARGQLPGWAEKREVQMDLLAERIPKVIED